MENKFFAATLINFYFLLTVTVTSMKCLVHEIIKYRNGNSESSVICQYVCQLVLFVQPIRSFSLISMIVHCLHIKITTYLLVLINQLRKLDNSFSCELVSSLSAYESCLIYLEQSCQSYIIPMVWSYLGND